MEQAPQQTAVVLPADLPADRSMPLELLSAQAPFKGLDEADLRQVAQLMRPLTFQPGEFVFRQGTPPDGAYVLESGEMLMWLRIGDIRRDLVRFQPGNTLCLASIVESSGRVTSMEATAPSRVWVLDMRSFNALRVQGHPLAYRTLMSAATEMGRAFCGSLLHMAEAFKLPLEPSPAPADALPEGRAISAADDALLQVVPFVKAMSPREQQALRKHGRLYDVKRGHRLLARGGAATPFFGIIRGALEALLEVPGGKERLSIRGPGRWVGHEGCISGVPQPYSVVARESSVLLGFDRATLDALFTERDSLAMRLLEQICSSITDQFNRDSSDLFKRNAERMPDMTLSADNIQAGARKALG